MLKVFLAHSGKLLPASKCFQSYSLLVSETMPICSVNDGS